jgi:hypothetical protein
MLNEHGSLLRYNGGRVQTIHTSSTETQSRASKARTPCPIRGGQALGLAVQAGKSRYGSSSGHGMGFNRLLLGLADQHALLRFRSGDSLLELDGTGQGAMSSRVAQRAFGAGFLIAVRCARR